MTAVQIRSAQAQAPSLPARAHDIVAFEWIKLRSVRSTYITLLIAAVVTIGATAIVAHAVASAPKPPPGGFSALSVSFLAYAEYTVIPVSVLAALQFTSEYSSGLIRTTFAAVPQRWTVLAGKAAVVGAASLVIGEALAFGASHSSRRSCPASTGGFPWPSPACQGPCSRPDSSCVPAR
jgi:hypothetical protein